MVIGSRYTLMGQCYLPFTSLHWFQLYHELLSFHGDGKSIPKSAALFEPQPLQQKDLQKVTHPNTAQQLSLTGATTAKCQLQEISKVR